MKKSNRLNKCLQISLIIICLSMTSSIKAQCDFYGDVLATLSAFEASNTQQYVLVEDNAGVPGNINAINNSATFTSVSAGNYWLYAVNYEGTQPSELAIGLAWSGVEAFDANTINCFEISAAYLGKVLSVCDIIEVCEPDDISVSTSNETILTGYSQTYVLVDNANQILESNNTGTFPIADYVSDGDFFVYAVNTNENSVNTEISDKGSWSDIDVMQGGSLCLNIISLPVKVIDVAICSVVLPIELLSFKGEAMKETNFLVWETATEINNDFFELQSSENGLNFNTIFKTKGAGNSSEKLSYEFMHYNPYKLNYYRLKQVDYDGTTSLSKTISINRNLSNDFEVKIFPTLIKDNVINLEFYSTSDFSNIDISIKNLLGQEVFNKSSQMFSGKNELKLEHSLSNGCYFVSVNYDHIQFTQKIIIEK